MILRAVVGAALALSVAAPPAVASSWPLAGGDASRSGFAAHGGGLPASTAWTAPGSAVRTPVVVTGGGGPETQRVAFGTADGRVHVHVLATGAPVGPEEGVPAADAALTEPAAAFGRGLVAAGFADTSTADRLGVLYAAHNDGGGIELLRIDLVAGTRLDETDTALPGTLGCGVSGSLLLTPPADDGSRILYFPIRGACSAGAALVRVPIAGDAALPTARLGAPTFAQIDGLSGGASPSLVVLPGAGGARFHVAVPRVGGVDFFDAARPLATEPAVLEPDRSAELPPGEVPMTVSAPATAEGLVAGARGAGTPPADALYVATDAGAATRVHRVAAATLATLATAELPGLPATGLALAQTTTPTGPSPGGTVLAGTSAGLTLLRTEDLSVVAQRPGSGFAEAVPVAGPRAAFAVRSAPGDPAEVLALDGALQATTLVQGAAGTVPGQPAMARGLLLAGGPDGVTALRLRDADRPEVALIRPRRGSRLRRGARVRLVARAADDAGVRSVAFRLHRGGKRRIMASASAAAFTDRGRFAVRARVPRVRPGRYRLVAVATDAAGNTARAVRRVRVRR